MFEVVGGGGHLVVVLQRQLRDLLLLRRDLVLHLNLLHVELLQLVLLRLHHLGDSGHLLGQLPINMRQTSTKSAKKLTSIPTSASDKITSHSW